MPKRNNETSLLLGLIPVNLCKPEQKAQWRQAWREVEDMPAYELLRDPEDLSEFNHYNCRLAIWRKNGTITFVSPKGYSGFPDHEKQLYLSFRDEDICLNITGKTDHAIAQTAAYFIGLIKATETTSPYLFLNARASFYEFRGAGSRCLTNLFKASPSCLLDFERIKLSVQQTVALATQTHPIRVIFANCEFEDHGTAFVDALENRKPSSFGTLRFINDTALSYENLRRLFQLDAIRHLEIPVLENCLQLLAFSMKVEHLECEFCTSLLSKSNVEALNIVAKKLSVEIKIDDKDEPFPTQPVISFLRRIAELAHFKEIKIKIFVNADMTIPDCIAQELIRATLANEDMEILDLCNDDGELEWDLHMETLFRGLKDHKKLHTLKVLVHDTDGAFGPNFSYLRQLLSQNRFISVTKGDGSIYTDGGSIDELCSLNRFFRGSVALATKQSMERSLLVASALMKAASGNFQRIGLLLSDHVDLLLELVQDGEGMEGVEEKLSLSNHPKRRRRI
jgi:hypothetical protein